MHTLTVAILLILSPLFAFATPLFLNTTSDLATSTKPVVIDYAEALASGKNIFVPITRNSSIPANYSLPLASLERLRKDQVSAKLDGLICETSSGSPYYIHTLPVVLFLFDLKNQLCCQTKAGNSCTRVGYYETSEVHVCGPQNKCIVCGFVGLAAELVNQGCRKQYTQEEKAGGRYGWDTDVQLQIYVSHT